MTIIDDLIYDSFYLSFLSTTIIVIDTYQDKYLPHGPIAESDMYQMINNVHTYAIAAILYLDHSNTNQILIASNVIDK